MRFRHRMTATGEGREATTAIIYCHAEFDVTSTNYASIIVEPHSQLSPVRSRASSLGYLLPPPGTARALNGRRYIACCATHRKLFGSKPLRPETVDAHGIVSNRRPKRRPGHCHVLHGLKVGVVTRAQSQVVMVFQVIASR